MSDAARREFKAAMEAYDRAVDALASAESAEAPEMVAAMTAWTRAFDRYSAAKEAYPQGEQEAIYEFLGEARLLIQDIQATEESIRLATEALRRTGGDVERALYVVSPGVDQADIDWWRDLLTNIQDGETPSATTATVTSEGETTRRYKGNYPDLGMAPEFDGVSAADATGEGTTRQYKGNYRDLGMAPKYDGTYPRALSGRIAITPDEGLLAHTDPDTGAVPWARLEGGIEVLVLTQWGSWAWVMLGDGEFVWVDGRRLLTP